MSISSGDTSPKAGTRYSTWAAVSTWSVSVAVTAETTRGPRLSIAMVPRMISATKNDPAIGAL